jgi:hypothetical protein
MERGRKIKAATIGCHLNTATYVTTLIVINLAVIYRGYRGHSRGGVTQGPVNAKE